VLLPIAVALSLAGPALADADPASDVLYQHSLFLPYKAKVSPSVERDLLAAIARSRKAGKEVRVALIAAPGDLGGVPQLFGNPLYYTRFLDAELQFVYTGRMLVVMPQGAGLAKGGRLVADESVIAARPGSSGDDLARTATQLVDAISSGNEAPAPTTVSVPAPTASVPAPSRARTHTVNTATTKAKGVPVGLATGIAIGIVAVILAIGGVVLARRGRA
jgi:hypothetical protein